MSQAKRKHKKGLAVRTIFSVLLLLIVLGAGIGLYYFTDGFTTSLNSFFVKINDEKILSDSNGVTVEFGEELSVKCCYLADSITGAENALGYSFEVVPNVDAEHDFIIQVDGSSTLFSKLNAFTESFEVTEEKGGFRLKVNATVPEMIQKQFDSEIVILDDSIEWDKYCYFALVVYSGDKKSSIRIPFRYIYSVTGIELSESEVIL